MNWCFEKFSFRNSILQLWPHWKFGINGPFKTGFQRVNHDIWHYNMVTQPRQIKLHFRVTSVSVLRHFWHFNVFWSVNHGSQRRSVTCCPFYNWDIAIFMILLILFWINRLTFLQQSRQRSNILRREILQTDHTLLHSNYQFAIDCLAIDCF